MSRLRLVLGLTSCAVAALPATARAAEPGPCYKDICPVEIVQEVLTGDPNPITYAYEAAMAEYDELQEFYRGVEDDLNRYLCRQTGNPTYCNH